MIEKDDRPQGGIQISGDRGEFIITDDMLMLSEFSPGVISEALEAAARARPDLHVVMIRDDFNRKHTVRWEPLHG